jgi:hypothetical protein
MERWRLAAYLMAPHLRTAPGLSQQLSSMMRICLMLTSLMLGLRSPPRSVGTTVGQQLRKLRKQERLAK